MGIMNEEQLLKAFEEYKGYPQELFDIANRFEFKAFCAGYKLKEKESQKSNIGEMLSGHYFFE